MPVYITATNHILSSIGADKFMREHVVIKKADMERIKKLAEECGFVKRLVALDVMVHPFGESGDGETENSFGSRESRVESQERKIQTKVQKKPAHRCVTSASKGRDCRDEDGAPCAFCVVAGLRAHGHG